MGADFGFFESANDADHNSGSDLINTCARTYSSAWTYGGIYDEQ